MASLLDSDRWLVKSFGLKGLGYCGRTTEFIMYSITIHYIPSLLKHSDRLHDSIEMIEMQKWFI